MPFTLIAHRGFSSRAPENTFYAFDLALDHGFDNVELDAQLTSDGELAVFHDQTVDRITDGSGPVSSHTLAELRALDAAAGFTGDGRDYSGARIPTLDEFLERYSGKAHAHLELKSREAALPEKVAEALRRRGWLEYADGGPFDAPGLTITSFWADQLYRSVVRLPNVRHGWLVNEVTEETLEAASRLGINGVYPRAATANPEIVNAAREKGFTVRGWGVGSLDDLANLARSGAQGTTVDWPDAARDHLAGLGVV
ncbi:MAG: glycerophosphodiester phosphodiesterase [Chloroflexota bacterium]